MNTEQQLDFLKASQWTLRRAAGNVAIWLRSAGQCSPEFLVSLGRGLEETLRAVEAAEGTPCPRCGYLLTAPGTCTHCQWCWTIEEEPPRMPAETPVECGACRAFAPLGRVV